MVHADLDFAPAAPERWRDLERLFGERGACGGCWCMWYRLPRRDYEEGKGAVNRGRLRALVEGGRPTGVLAYAGGEPVGWCSVAPREEHVRLRTARAMRPPDARPAWVIICLFVTPELRHRGVSVALIRAAARHAAERGAPLVEAYPIVPTADVAPPFASQGTLAAYLAAGFTEVARPSATRAVVRWEPG